MNELNYLPEIQEVISSGRALHVLVVDDSKMVRSAIREILELGGIRVTEAHSGRQALQSVASDRPDLVLLDVVMPDVDGVSLLKTLRNNYSKLQLPVVLVTSKEGSNEIVRALDFGANDYVTKPIDFDVLWARISNQLMQKQAAEYLTTAQAVFEKQIRQRTAELDSSNQQLKQEIADRLQTENQLQRQANFDVLTGLPNRSLANDRLNQAVAKAKRHGLKPCVAFLDLDNFKYVNDTFGHAAGDELLKEAARRLTVCARESDTVARLGGDEFLLILDDNNVSEHNIETDVRHIGERVIESFAQAFVIEGEELNITPSLGFAIYPKDGDDCDSLLRNADAAMYRSKREGKNTYCFYSTQMTAKEKRRLQVEEQLRHAIERREMSLNYQPIVDLSDGSIARAEVLLRWNCDSLGVVMPDYFIAIAEDAGLMPAIGAWVIQTACRQLREWRDCGWVDLSLTINITERQLQSGAMLVDTIKAALQENDLDTDAIQLELCESLLLKDSRSIVDTIKQLEDIGIRLLIDNFGTEYASLSVLQRYNFDAIKIDRRCIANVLEVEQDANLVKAVIAMAKSMGVSVISEGVESAAQFEFLLHEQCEHVQGHCISEAVDADALSVLLGEMNMPCREQAGPALQVSGLS